MQEMSPLIARAFAHVGASATGLTAPELAKLEKIPEKEATWVLSRLVSVFGVAEHGEDGRYKKK